MSIVINRREIIANILDTCSKKLESLIILSTIHEVDPHFSVLLDSPFDCAEISTIGERVCSTSDTQVEQELSDSDMNRLMDAITFISQNSKLQRFGECFSEKLEKREKRNLDIILNFVSQLKQHLYDTNDSDALENNEDSTERKEIFNEFNRKIEKLNLDISNMRIEFMDLQKSQAHNKSVHDKKMEELIINNKSKINENLSKTNREVIRINKEFEATLPILKDDCQKLAELYLAFVQDSNEEQRTFGDIVSEKAQILQNLIKNYDENIGLKRLALSELEKQMNREEEEFNNNWKNAYDEQDIIYSEIMRKVEAEEARVWEEKASHFVRNRSAKVIQKEFRRAFRKDSTKNKKKKGKAKK